MRASEFLVTALLCAAAVGCSLSKKAARPAPSEAPAADEAHADTPPAPAAPAARAIDWSAFDSISVRNPTDGSLQGGVPLPLEAPGLRFGPTRDPGARYGTLEMVRGLVRAADRVDRELGGLPLMVNDLSLEHGGPIPHHRSHQSGRDVDTLFYQLGPDGEPIESVGTFFDSSGAAVDFHDLADPSDDVALRLDLPRTWLFVQALIEDADAQIQRIFVAEHLRSLLLEYARKHDAPDATVARFADMTCQPGYPHDDHFHLRFFCAPDDIARGCRDSPPMYPWQRDKLQAEGLRSRPLAAKREKAKPKVVTHEEARKAAGQLDAEVERWLDLRKSWIAQPSPGRAYCP